MKYGFVVLAICVGLGIKFYFGDNPIEEEAEHVIETVVQEESGFDIKPLLG
jgi:hypothetical protein